MSWPQCFAAWLPSKWALTLPSAEAASGWSMSLSEGTVCRGGEQERQRGRGRCFQTHV